MGGVVGKVILFGEIGRVGYFLISAFATNPIFNLTTGVVGGGVDIPYIPIFSLAFLLFGTIRYTLH